MPESAHSSLKPKESDFSDSHPLHKDSSSSFDNLSAIESKMVSPNGFAPEIDDDNDVLGDITLLEEAFAELEEGGKNSSSNDAHIPVLSETVEPPTSFTPSQQEKFETDAASESIPLLDQQATVYSESEDNAAVEISNEIEEFSASEVNDDELHAAEEQELANHVSVGTTLSEPVAENSVPETGDELSTENINAQLNELSDEEVSSSLNPHLDQSVISSELHNAEPSTLQEMETSAPETNALPEEADTIDSVIDLAIMEKENTLGDEADDNSAQLSDMPSLTDEDLSMAYEQSLSKFAEDLENDDDEPSLEDLELDSETSSPDLIDSDFSFSETDSIEAKIAQAKGDNLSEVNEIPLRPEQMSELYEFQESQLDNHGSLSTIAEDLVMSELSDNLLTDERARSELIGPESTVNITSVIDEPPSGLSNNQEQSKYNLNIPFELHTQLSQKIDDLVLEATTSLTNELHEQLANRMEILLNNSVESVLPKLIEQMVGELRKEVKQQVKNQLPNIINEVLGRTRLRK